MNSGRRLDRIVLVHGSMHGAWCWEQIVPLLEGRGFDVDALDLPGAGEDQTPLKDVTLGSYVARIVETLRARPGPALVVGHSLGGMPVSGAAEAAPDRVAKLVYLAAMLPRDGDSLNSFGLDDPDSAARGFRPGTDGLTLEMVVEVAPQFFYNTCDAEIAARAAKRLRPQPTAPLFEKVNLSPERFGSIPKTYIVCTKDEALPVHRQNAFCDRTPGVKKRLLDTDHSPFYSAPESLVQMIVEEASI